MLESLGQASAIDNLFVLERCVEDLLVENVACKMFCKEKYDV
jgi:hypothetical protein